jgi:membrane protein YdbS with pleckstrin-like domain
VLDPLRRFLKRFLKVTDEPPEVPLGEQPEVFRASPRHLTYLLAQWAIKLGVVGLSLGGGIAGVMAAMIIEEKNPTAAVVIGVLGAAWLGAYALCTYAAIRLDYDMRWYVLTDRSLRIREGIIHVREVTLTLANVQELKVSQGPIQRLLDLTDLVVDTAGGGRAASSGGESVHGHQGILRGVDRGGDLRAKIEARVKQRPGAGLGDPDEHHHDAHDAVGGPQTVVEALRAVRDEARALRAQVAAAR